MTLTTSGTDSLRRRAIIETTRRHASMHAQFRITQFIAAVDAGIGDEDVYYLEHWFISAGYMSELVLSAMRKLLKPGVLPDSDKDAAAFFRELFERDGSLLPQYKLANDLVTQALAPLVAEWEHSFNEQVAAARAAFERHLRAERDKRARNMGIGASGHR
jgi:hypothetical protein